MRHVKTLNRSTPERLAALALFGACALSALGPVGCLDAPTPSTQTQAQTPNARIYLLALHGANDDVMGVQYDVICQDGTTISEYVPLEDEGLPSWLLSASAGSDHAFADLLTLLPANQSCTITATPMQSPGVPSADCAPATDTVTILPGVTQEIVLMMQCSGDPLGGLDVVAGLNHPPVISGLTLLPSKFILACESATIIPVVSDPDGDVVTTTMYVGQTPAGSNPVLTNSGGQWSFSTDLPGQYEIKIVATDPFGATSTLTFPIHVSPGDPALCNPDPTPVCCLLPDGSAESSNDVDCAAAAGQPTNPDACGVICCPLNEIEAFVAAPGTCFADDALPMSACDTVCCDVQDGQGPYEMSRRYCVDQGFVPSNEGACVTTVCCEQADGTYADLDAASCTSPVNPQLCDLGPTCCVRPDSTVSSMSVSACVEIGGQLSEDGCQLCALEPEGPGLMSQCLAPSPSPSPTVNPWSITRRVLWIDPDVASPSQPTTGTTPMIARMWDTNNDGNINDQDNAHVIVMGSGHDVNVIDAVTGTQRWSYGPLFNVQQPAVVDLDRDGSPEVLVIDPQGYVLALKASGGLLWQSAQPISAGLSHIAPAIQPEDLNGDMAVEVVIGSTILRGIDGTTLNTLPGPYHRNRVTIGDVDFDGVREIILADGVYDPFTGVREVALPTSYTSIALSHDALVQADLDPEPEIARLGGGEVKVFDTDGRLMFSSTSPFYFSTWFGSPCVGDTNGDGITEVISVTNAAPGIAGGSVRVNAFGMDQVSPLSFIWNSNLAWGSCSVADLNGDGLDEVLIGGDGLRILSLDPTLLTPLAYQDTAISPGQFDADNSYPTIADIDGDGASEVVVVWPRGTTNQGKLEVVVYEHSAEQWKNHGTSWQSFDYYPGRLSEGQSQTFAQAPAPWLIEGGAMHAKVAPADGVDLIAQIDGGCVASCSPGSQATLSVQLFNVGSLDHLSSTSLSVYANLGGAPTGPALATVTINTPVLAGQSAAGVPLTVNVSDIGPDGLIVIVDGANAIAECQEQNNATVWNENPCD